MRESKGDFTLSVAVSEVLFHRHLCVVAQHSLNHGSYLRRRAALQLGVDAGGLLLHVPIDHDSGTAIAHVPLGHQILVPSSELLSIASTGTRPFPPNMGMAGAKDGVNYFGDRFPQGLGLDKAPFDVTQVVIGDIRRPLADSLESGIGSQPVEAQQQALLNRFSV